VWLWRRDGDADSDEDARRGCYAEPELRADVHISANSHPARRCDPHTAAGEHLRRINNAYNYFGD